MGRTIVVDDHVQTAIGEFIVAGKWFTGVIIGQVTSQRDYVIHVAPTPDPVEDEALDDNENSESNTESTPIRKIARPSTLQQLDEKWVTTHSKQVTRMLPGGLSVIGIFAIAPTTQLQASQIKLKQIMFSVHKSLSKSHIQVDTDEITDRIILQIDSNSRKLTCTTLNVTDGKATPRPAEWKYQTSKSKWTRLDSQVSIDVTMAVEKDSKNQTSLHRQLQSGLSSFCESVRQSAISINGVLRDGKELLCTTSDHSEGKTGKGKGGGGRERSRGDTALNDDTPLLARIFLPFANSMNIDTTQQTPVIVPAVAALRMCGTFSIRAFVPVKATVDDAIKALKTDILRSIYARCELLCEEDIVTEEEDNSSVYNPPIRYYFPSPNSSVSLCDYAFEDEKEEEMKERIRELLSVDASQLENVESHATVADISVINPVVPEKEEDEVPLTKIACFEMNVGQARQLKQYMWPFIVLMLVLLGAMMFGTMNKNWVNS